MKQFTLRRGIFISLLGLSLSLGVVTGASALGNSNPRQSGATGMEGTISAPAPKDAPAIGQPVNGRSFTSSPITVSGLCSSGLLVEVFSNGVFAGGVQCSGGSFSLQVGLFSGQNNLTAIQYDALNQASPTSPTVSATYQDAQFASFGQPVSLTSQYAKLGADLGSQLTWPLVLSGGGAPYAISVDWGDGSSPELLSQSFAGQFNITHAYQAAGTYRVTVRASDTNGQSAFLQLVGVGNGKVTQANQTSGTGQATTPSGKGYVIWWPFLVFFPMAIAIFWLGQKYELREIHRQLDRRRY